MVNDTEIIQYRMNKSINLNQRRALRHCLLN